MAKGIEAWVFVPEKVGQDQNDILTNSMEIKEKSKFMTIEAK